MTRLIAVALNPISLSSGNRYQADDSGSNMYLYIDGSSGGGVAGSPAYNSCSRSSSKVIAVQYKFGVLPAPSRKLSENFMQDCMNYIAILLYHLLSLEVLQQELRTEQTYGRALLHAR
jgi:hypothetical protein